mgnify:CR=1 FL=1
MFGAQIQGCKTATFLLSVCLEAVPEVYSGKLFSSGKTRVLEPRENPKPAIFAAKAPLSNLH